jgi:hypothetical protein
MSVTAGDFLQSEAIYKKLPADKQTTHSSHDPKRVEQKPPRHYKNYSLECRKANAFKMIIVN